VLIFIKKEMGNILDHFARTLGIVMIIMVIYVLFKTKPPIVLTFKEIVQPSEINF